MSNIKFTTEQELAITLRDKNLLISASAGTGKTAVLVERIIRMATDSEKPVDLDRMLVVTFTNAASEEMKIRIRSALYQEIKKNPENQRLRKQLIMLGQASISTIHSFCSEVIRSNYQLLDIDPGFSVGDANESDGFLKDAVTEVLFEAFEKGDRSFIALADGYGRGRDDERLVKLLMSFYKKIRSLPFYKDWLHKNGERFYEKVDDFANTIWGKTILSYSAARLSGYIDDIKDMISSIADNSDFQGYYNTLENELSMLMNLNNILSNSTWDDCSAKVKVIEFERIGRAGKNADDLLKSIVKDTRNDYKAEIVKIKKRLSGTSQEIMSNMKEMQPLMAMLISLLLKTDDNYIKIKNKNGILDYSDLEHYALDCLSSEAGVMYRDRFDEVFVDEYQDSNQIQESIINFVSGRGRDEKNVFMVGDIKQSIYRFRQADPSIFVKKYNSFSKNALKDEVSINLFRNYRSRFPVLDFTNYIFSRIMSREMGDIDYTDNVYLMEGIKYPFGKDEDYPVDIALVCGEDDVLFNSDITSDEKEAAAVGGQIQSIINSRMNILDRGTGLQRDVDYRDITILLRNANKVSAAYIRQLKKMGIPVKSESNSDFFKEREIIIIKSFLEVIDNPRRDIPLIALLRSPIFAFTDKELAYIRVDSARTSYYDAMLNFSANKALVVKISAFKSVISNFKEQAYNRSMDKLIWDILQETGFYTQTVSDENTKTRMSNMRRFFEIAGQFERGRETGLFAFLGYLNNLEESGTNGAHNTGNMDNTVKIMSIHKSKGLEFPVVILGGCGKAFNKMEIRENILFDSEFGFGPEYINADAGLKFTTAIKKSIKIKKDIEGIAEEMRVLYVAMTRAREKLVITGYVKNLDKSIGRWILRGQKTDGKISPGKVMLASGYIDWVMSVLINQRKVADLLLSVKNSETFYENKELNINFTIINPEIIHKLMKDKAVIEKEEKNAVNLSYEEVKERFSWEYPYLSEKGLHKKVSVTEIKKLRESTHGEKDIFGTSFIKRPDFMSEKGKDDAAERGTLLHNIIAAADLKKVNSPDYIESLFESTGVESEKLEKYARLIKGFFNSSLGKRMIASAKSESEKPFLIPVLTSRLYPGKVNLPDKNHTTLVQGVIDSLFYEKDGIVIVDYKSDNVIAGNEENHAARYKLQLDLYAFAVKILTGVTVKAKYIYFLKTQSEVLLP